MNKIQNFYNYILKYIFKNIKYISIVLCLIGVGIISIYFYELGFEMGFKKGLQEYRISTTFSESKKPVIEDKKIPFKNNPSLSSPPVMQKPSMYSDNISGTLTYNNAIKIAQEYYDKQNYHQAMIWAYRANQMDKKDMKSWIIYTQSLFNLGEKQKAIDLLQEAKKFFGS